MLQDFPQTIPTGATSGQFGFVFGYKSGADYWLEVLDMAGSEKIRRIHPAAALRRNRLAASLAGRGRRLRSDAWFHKARHEVARLVRRRRGWVARHGLHASRLNEKEGSRENGFNPVLLEKSPWRPTFSLTVPPGGYTGASANLVFREFNGDAASIDDLDRRPSTITADNIFADALRPSPNWTIHSTRKI